jgi:hypothetical protein
MDEHKKKDLSDESESNLFESVRSVRSSTWFVPSECLSHYCVGGVISECFYA